MKRLCWRAVTRYGKMTKWLILRVFSAKWHRVFQTNRLTWLVMGAHAVAMHPINSGQTTMHLFLNRTDLKEYSDGHPIWQRPQHEKEQPG
jgi:hypothetical protein